MTERVVAGSGPRTAVVTGGSRGLGRAIAERLLADGHRVCVLDVEPDPECGFDWRACDVTDPDALQRAIDDVVPGTGASTCWSTTPV